jgi:uncharacterized protein (TIGR02246 family)
MAPFYPLCLCVLCGAPMGGHTTQDKAAPEAIMQVLTNQVEAWNKGDLKGFMAGYQRSGDLTFYSGATVFKGWDAILERYQKKYQAEGKEMGKLTFRDIDIEMLGPDSAVVRGRWELKTSKEMPAGLFTLIVRKTPEGWRIVHDHTSN